LLAGSSAPVVSVDLRSTQQTAATKVIKPLKLDLLQRNSSRETKDDGSARKMTPEEERQYCQSKYKIEEQKVMHAMLKEYQFMSNAMLTMHSVSSSEQQPE
jgi:hypothetical protein